MFNHKYLFGFLLVMISFSALSAQYQNKGGKQERKYLIQSLTKIADPLLNFLSQKQLKQKMPLDKTNGLVKSSPSTYL